MNRQRYNLQLPITELHQLAQNEAFFYLNLGSEKIKIRFHDYADLYKHPNLYEQLYYERLKCNSPAVVTSILKNTIDKGKETFSELRVLDVGAGNGMMGEELFNLGVARVVGVDIIEEARQAALRDRPGIYDEYYITDLTQMTEDDKTTFQQWQFNCMTCVAALGFGDIPSTAFITAFNLVENGGWIAINIKETFLDKTDDSGFSLLIKEMIMNQIIDIHHLERYRHRISIDGRPLFYYALIARKESNWIENV
jgi:predicted TPR repeat methyltransferase